MKKVRSVLALFLSALAVFCLVCTCAPPTDGDEEDASITITIGNGSRTALSWDGTIDSTQLDHNITLTNDSGGKVEKTGVREGQSVQFVVKPGHWNISVKAYYKGTLVAQGAASVNLKRGRNPSVPITMTQVGGSTGGNGETTDTPITVADITITGPAKGATPAAAVASEAERFTAGTVIWSPADNPFKGSTVYTATVTLTAKNGFTFQELLDANVKVNGEIATTVTRNENGTITLSYTFVATGEKAVSGIAIVTQPTKLTYTHGDKLDLAGLAVTLTYDDGSTENVAASGFTAKNIATSPGHDTPLERSEYNGKPVEMSIGNVKANTNNLTVNAKNVSNDNVIIEAIPSQTYTGSAIVPAVNVTHQVTETTRELVQGTDYTLAYADNTDVGTAKVTVSGINDYMGSRTVNFTINKANPSSWPTATGITYGATLSTSTLSGGDTHGNFAWADGTTVPPAGTNAYGVTFTPYDTANYNTATGTVSISVAKADPTVADFEIGNSNSKQMVGNITAVTVTPHDGKSDGNITIYYNGSTALPTAVGIYTVTFNVGEGTNYKAATGFSAGTITIFDYDYITDDIGDRSYGWEFIDFNTWLDAQPKNTPETPYIIALNISNAWQPENELIHISASYEKYVYFDLSGGTLTTIPDYAFGGGTFDSYGFGLVGITIPASVTSIGNYALNSQPGGQDPCANLTSVIFAPNSKLTSIGASAFAYCSSLTSIDIPDSVISIGGAAFYNCTSLTNITIPEGVTSIATNTFQNCTSLTSITFKRADISISSWPTTIINANSTTSLLSAYASGGIGTYTRESGGSVWTKQE